MANPEQIRQDQATILAIVKHILVFTVIGLFLYIGYKALIVLIPFIIGFILARVAWKLIVGARLIWNRLRRGNKPALEKDQTNVPKEVAEVLKTEVPIVEDGEHIVTPKLTKADRHDRRLKLIVYFILILLIFGLLAGVLIIAVGQMRSILAAVPALLESRDLSAQVMGLIDRVASAFGGLASPTIRASIQSWVENLQQQAVTRIPEIAAAILGWLGNTLASLPMAVFYVIVIILSGYYFIMDTEALRRFLRRNVTSRLFRDKTIQLINALSQNLFRIIGGYMLLMLITFAMVLITLLAVGIPYAVVIALIAAVLDLMPVLGLGVTMIPVAIYLFATGNIVGGIIALVALAAMTVIRSFIDPHIVGNAMSLHPLATLLAMVTGVALFGVGGVIVGPVLFVIAKEAFNLFPIGEKLREFGGALLGKVVE